jgi:hypothetical protein
MVLNLLPNGKKTPGFAGNRLPIYLSRYTKKPTKLWQTGDMSFLSYMPQRSREKCMSSQEWLAFATFGF